MSDLDLSSNQLSGSIPNSVYQLKSMMFLRLSNNKLSGKISKDIGGFPHLAVFDAANNQLTGVIPAEIINCTSLEKGTSFSGNKLSVESEKTADFLKKRGIDDWDKKCPPEP